MHIQGVLKRSRPLNISENISFIGKCLRQKLQDLKRSIYWSYQFDFGWRRQGQVKITSIFLNGVHYFLLHILIA